MNYLYITNNIDLVRTIAKEYTRKNKLGWAEFENNRENMTNIVKLYNNEDNLVIFLIGINKSNVSDTLLKILEDNKKNIVMFATTSTYDVKEALQARFEIKHIQNIDIEKDVKEFLTTKKATKEVYSTLNFYVELANNTTDINNIILISDIIQDTKLCTYNTPWDYYYMILKQRWR